MKRFWKDVAVVDLDDGFGIALDNRPVKTPTRADLKLPTRALADAVAAEWAAVGETIDPRAMPLTGLANAAIDRVAADPARFAVDLAGYGESDLFCYRADGPAPLVERQGVAWDRLLDWARQRYGVDFAITAGIIHAAQPPATIAALGEAVERLDPYRLAGLAPLVTIGGSLVAALAVLDGAATPEAAWDAVTVDDAWQAEQWGEDAEAVAALSNRRRDFEAAARFLALLDA